MSTNFRTKPSTGTRYIPSELARFENELWRRESSGMARHHRDAGHRGPLRSCNRCLAAMKREREDRAVAVVSEEADAVGA